MWFISLGLGLISRGVQSRRGMGENIGSAGCRQEERGLDEILCLGDKGRQRVLGRREREMGPTARRVKTKQNRTIRVSRALRQGDIGSITEGSCPGEAKLEAMWEGRDLGSEGKEQTAFQEG